LVPAEKFSAPKLPEFILYWHIADKLGHRSRCSLKNCYICLFLGVFFRQGLIFSHFPVNISSFGY